MRNHYLKRFLVLCIMILAVPLSGCTKNQIDTHGKITGNEGASVSYLSQLDKEVVIKVFNFDQKKVIKTMQSNAKIENNGFCPTGISYYNPVEKKTLLFSNNEKPDGYQVYVQDQTEVKKLGLVRGNVSGAVFQGNILYAVVYQNTDSCEIRKYQLSNIDRPLQAWKIKGDPQKILMDHETGTVYALSAETEKNRTYLTTITPSGTCIQKELFTRAYHLDATINKNKIWIACNCILEEKAEKSIDVKDIFVYDLKTDKIEKKFSTEHPPKTIKVNDEMIYLISQKNITEYVEYLNWKTGARSKTTELEDGTKVFGFVLNKNGKFLFTSRGVFTLINGNERKVTDESYQGPQDRVETKIL